MRIQIVLCCLFVLASLSFSRPTSTWNDYLIILVHGVSGDPQKHASAIWDEDIDGFVDVTGNMITSLKSLGVDENNTYYYNFSDPNENFFDSDITLSAELGNRHLWRNPQATSSKYESRLSKGVKDNGIVRRYRKDPTDEDDTDEHSNRQKASVPPLNDMCWIEQSIKNWEQKYCDNQSPKLGFPDEVNKIPLDAYPKKIILIGHSMGGLTSRSYIFSPFYRGDVDKLLTINTPHHGSDILPLMANNAWAQDAPQAVALTTLHFIEDLALIYAIEEFQKWLLPKLNLGFDPTPFDRKLLSACASAGASAGLMTLFAYGTNSLFGYEGNEDAVLDMIPFSPELLELQEKDQNSFLDPNYKLPMFRIVYGDGVPTPAPLDPAYNGFDPIIKQSVDHIVDVCDNALRSKVRQKLGFDLPVLKFALNPDYWEKSCFDRSLIDILGGGFDPSDVAEPFKMSFVNTGGADLGLFKIGDFSEDGDMFVPVKSQKGELIRAFQTGNTKKYHVDFNRYEKEDEDLYTLSDMEDDLEDYELIFVGLDFAKLFADPATKKTIDGVKLGIGALEILSLAGTVKNEIDLKGTSFSTILPYLSAHGTSVGATHNSHFTRLADISTEKPGVTILEDALYEKPFVSVDSIVLYGADAAAAVTVKKMSFGSSDKISIIYLNATHENPPLATDYSTQEIDLYQFTKGTGSTTIVAERLSKEINDLALADGNVYASFNGPIVSIFDGRLAFKLDITTTTSTDNIQIGRNGNTLMHIARSVVNVRVDRIDFDGGSNDANAKVFDGAAMVSAYLEDDGIQINDKQISYSNFNGATVNDVATNLKDAINNSGLPFIHAEIVSGKNNVVRVIDDSYNTLRIREINTHTYNFTISLAEEFKNHQPQNQVINLNNELEREAADVYAGVPYRVRDLNTGDIHYYQSAFTAKVPPLELKITVDDFNPAKLTSFGLDINYGALIKFKFDGNEVSLVDELGQGSNFSVKGIAWDKRSLFTITFASPLAVFKEGRNLIRFVTQNPAGYHNFQLMYFDVFSTPPIASNFLPSNNSNINESNPLFRFRVNFVYGQQDMTSVANIKEIGLSVDAEEVNKPYYEITLGSADSYPAGYSFTIQTPTKNIVFPYYPNGKNMPSNNTGNYWILYNEDGGYYLDGKGTTYGQYSFKTTANVLAHLIESSGAVAPGCIEVINQVSGATIRLYPNGKLFDLVQSSEVTDGISLRGRATTIITAVSLGNMEADDKIIIDPDGAKTEISMSGVSSVEDIRSGLAAQLSGYTVTIEGGDQVVVRSLTRNAPLLKLVDNFTDNMSIVGGQEDIKLFEPDKGYNSNAEIKTNKIIAALVSSKDFDSGDEFVIHYKDEGQSEIIQTYNAFTGNTTTAVATAFTNSINTDFSGVLKAFCENNSLIITPENAEHTEIFTVSQDDFQGWTLEFEAFPPDQTDEVVINGQVFTVEDMASASDFASAINASTNKSLQGIVTAEASGASSVIVKNVADGLLMSMSIRDNRLVYEISLNANAAFVAGDQLRIAAEQNPIDEFNSIALNELAGATDAQKLQDLLTKICSADFRINMEKAYIADNTIVYVVSDNTLNVYFSAYGSPDLPGDISIQRTEPSVAITKTQLSDNISFSESPNEFIVVYTPAGDQELTTNGVYGVHAKVESDGGQEAQANWQFNFDTKPPYFSYVTAPKILSSNVLGSDRVPISFYAGDNVSGTLTGVSVILSQKGTANFSQIPIGDIITGNRWVNWDARSRSEGVWQIKFTANDLVPNHLIESYSGKDIIIDNTAPTIGAIAMTNPVITGGNANTMLGIQINVSDNLENIDAGLSEYPDTVYVKYQFIRLNSDKTLGSVFRNIEAAYDVSPSATAKVYEMDFSNGAHMLLSDGFYKCSITGKDLAGNQSAATVSNEITIDMTPPRIFDFITSNFINRTGQDIALSFKVSEQFDDEIIRTANTSVTFKSPRIVISKPNGTEVTISSGFTETVVSNDQSVGVPYRKYEITWSGADVEGEYFAEARVTDNYATGANEASARTFFNVGSIKPHITFPSDGSEFETSQSIIIQGTATDPTKALPDFKEYSLSYKKQGDADYAVVGLTAFQSKSNVSTTPVPEGVLGYWNLAGLQASDDGITYFLKVSTTDGVIQQSHEVSIVLKNTVAQNKDFTFSGLTLTQDGNAVNNSDKPAEFKDGTSDLLISYQLSDDNEIKVQTPYKIRAEIYNQKGTLLFNHVDDKVYATGLEGAPDLSSTTTNDSGFYVWITNETIGEAEYTVWNVRMVGGTETDAEYLIGVSSDKPIRLPYTDNSLNYYSPNTEETPDIDISALNPSHEHSIAYSVTPGHDNSTHAWLKFIPTGEDIFFSFARNDQEGIHAITGFVDEPALVFAGPDKSQNHGMFGPVLAAGVPGFVKWDGLATASRTLVTSGTYSLKLIAENPENGIVHEQNTDFKVSVKNVALSGYAVPSTTIIPYDPSNAEKPNFSTVTVEFNINRDAYIDIIVRDVTVSGAPKDLGKLVDNQLYAGKLDNYTYTWNGTYNGATRIKNGCKYQLVVKAKTQENVDGNTDEYPEQIEPKDYTSHCITAVDNLTKSTTQLLVQPGIVMASDVAKYNDPGSFDYFWKADISGVYAPDYPYEATVEFKGVQQVDKFPYERFSFGINRRRNKVNLVVVAAFHASGSEYWSRGAYCRADGGKHYYGGTHANVTLNVDNPWTGNIIDFRKIIDDVRTTIYDDRGFSVFDLHSIHIGVFPATAFSSGFDFNAFYKNFAANENYPLDHNFPVLEIFTNNSPVWNQNKPYQQQDLLWQRWEDKDEDNVYDLWEDNNNNGVWDDGEGDDPHDDKGVRGTPGDGILDVGEGDGQPTRIGNDAEEHIDKFAGAFYIEASARQSDYMRMGSWPCPKRYAGVSTTISIGIKKDIWRAWENDGYGYNSFLNLFSTWDPANVFAYSAEGYVNWDNFDNDCDGQYDAVPIIKDGALVVAPEENSRGDLIPENHGYVRWGNEPLKFGTTEVTVGTKKVVRGNIQRIDIFRLMDTKYLDLDRPDGEPDYGKLEFANKIYKFIDGQEQLVLRPFNAVTTNYPDCAFLLTLEIYTNWSSSGSHKKTLTFLSNDKVTGLSSSMTDVIGTNEYINLILSSSASISDDASNNRWSMRPADGLTANETFVKIDSIIASVCLVGLEDGNRSGFIATIPWPVTEQMIQDINFNAFSYEAATGQTEAGYDVTSLNTKGTVPGFANDEGDFAILFDGANPLAALTHPVRLGLLNGSVYNGKHLYKNRVIRWDAADRTDYIKKNVEDATFVPRYEDMIKYSNMGSGIPFTENIIDEETEISAGSNVVITDVYPEENENILPEIVGTADPAASYVKYTRKGYGASDGARFKWTSSENDNGLSMVDDDFDGEIDDSERDPSDIVQDGADNTLNEDPSGLVTNKSSFVLGKSDKFIDRFKDSYSRTTHISILDINFETNDALSITVGSASTIQIAASSFSGSDKKIIVENIKNAIEADSRLNDLTASIITNNDGEVSLSLGSTRGDGIEIAEAVVTTTKNLEITNGSQDNSSVLRLSGSSLQENSAIGISTGDLKSTQYRLYYINGEENKDIELLPENVNPGVPNEAMGDDNYIVTVKTAFPGAPKRFIEIKGAVEGSYQILFSKNDGSFGMINDRKNDDAALLSKVVSLSNASNSKYTTLGFWDVTQLQGFYTVYLIQYEDGGIKNYDTKDVYIGDEVTSTRYKISSPYGRSSLVLNGAFDQGDIIRIVPVSLDEAGLKATGIAPVGPIVKALPSQKFGVVEIQIKNNTFDAADGLVVNYKDSDDENQTVTISSADIVGADKNTTLKNLELKLSQAAIPHLVLEVSGDVLSLYRDDAGYVDLSELNATTKNLEIAGGSNFPILEVMFTWNEIQSGGWMPDLENLSLYHVGENGELNKIANARREYYICSDPNTCNASSTPVAADFKNITDPESRLYSYVLLKGEPVSFSQFAVFNERLLAGDIKFAPLALNTDLNQIALQGTYIYIDALYDEAQTTFSTEPLFVYQDDDPIFQETNDPTPPVKLTLAVSSPGDFSQYGQEINWEVNGPVTLKAGDNYFFAKYGLMPGTTDEIKSNVFNTHITKIDGSVRLDFNESTNLRNKYFSINAGTKPSFTFKVWQKSKVILDIRDLNNTMVCSKSIEIDNTAKESVHSLVWDGTNTAGKEVEDGEYIYRLYAVDDAGRTNEQFGNIYRGTVIHDEQAPSIIVQKPILGSKLENLAQIKGIVNENTSVNVIRIVSEYSLGTQGYSPYVQEYKSVNTFDFTLNLKEVWPISDAVGKLTVTYYAEDLAGNSTQCSKEYVVDFATYYVDGTSGDDVSNDGRTSLTPFKTIKHAIEMLPAGFDRNYTIYLAGGDYTSEGVIGIEGIGTGNAYGLVLTSGSTDIGNRAIVNGINCKVENITISGITFQPVLANQTAVVITKKNTSINNCLFIFNGTIVYQNGILYDGTAESVGCDNVVVCNCIFDNIDGDAILYNTGSNSFASGYWRVFNNTAYQCGTFFKIIGSDENNRLLASSLLNNVVDAGTKTGAKGYELELAAVPADPSVISNLTITNNVVYGLTQINTYGFEYAASNIAADPQLKTTASFDKYLMPALNSPCVNAGAAIAGLNVDVYFHERHDGPDIGAVEYYDNTPPVVSSLLPASNSAINTTTLHIAGHVTDDLSDVLSVSVKISKNGVDDYYIVSAVENVINNEDISIDINLADKVIHDDVLTILVNVSDDAGNTTHCAIHNVTIMTAAPITIAYPSSTEFTDQILISFTVDPNDALTYYSEGADQSYVQYNQPILVKESTRIRYYSVDAAGNTESVKEKSYERVAPRTVEKSVYVALNGSDISGVGTISNPYRTIQHAYDALPASISSTEQYVVYVAEGEYSTANDKMIINRNLGLQRYNKIVIRALNTDDKPIIRPVVSSSQYVLNIGTSNVVFHGIIFKNSSSNGGGFVTISGSNVVFDKCLFVDEKVSSNQSIRINNILNDINELTFKNCYFEGPAGTTNYYGVRWTATNNVQHTGFVLSNNTFYRSGILSLTETSSNTCFSSSTNIIQNNVCVDAPLYGLDYMSGNSIIAVTKCLIYNASSGATNGNWSGSGAILTSNPLIMSYSPASSDFLRQSSTAPTINQGLENSYTPTVDIFNALRGTQPDIGASEYVPASVYYVSVNGTNSNSGLSETAPLADIQAALTKINTTETGALLSRNYSIVLIDGSKSSMHQAFNTDILAAKTHSGGTLSVKAKTGISSLYITGQTTIDKGYVTVSNIEFDNKTTNSASLEIQRPNGTIKIDNCGFAGVSGIRCIVDDNIHDGKIIVQSCRFHELTKDAVSFVETTTLTKAVVVNVLNNLFVEVMGKALYLSTYQNDGQMHITENVYNNTFERCAAIVTRYAPGGDYRNNIFSNYETVFDFEKADQTKIILKNNDFYGAAASTYKIASVYSATPDGLNCVASGNIAEDPELVFDLAHTQNPSLRNTSACIDAGDNDVLNMAKIEADFLDEPRIINTTIDIGAFEYQYQVDITPPEIQNVSLSYATVLDKPVTNNSIQFVSSRTVTIEGMIMDAVSSYCELYNSFKLNQSADAYYSGKDAVLLPGGRFTLEVPFWSNIREGCDQIQVTLIGRDEQGNECSAFAFSVTLDQTKPTTSFSTPAISQSYTTPLNISFYTNDADASVWYSNSGDPSSTGLSDAVEFPNNSSPILLSGETKTYYYRAKDKAGNWEEHDPCKSVTFTYIPPVLEYYVSLYGDDVTGDGTQNNPFREVNRAFEEVAADLSPNTSTDFPSPVYVHITDEGDGQINGQPVFKHFQTSTLANYNPTSSAHLIISGMKPERVTVTNHVAGGNNETIINKNYVDIFNVTFDNFELPYPGNPEQSLQIGTEYIVPQYISAEGKGMVQLTSGQHITITNCKFLVPEIPNLGTTATANPFNRNYGLAILNNSAANIKIEYSTFDGNNGIYIKGANQTITAADEAYTDFGGIFINAATFNTTTWRALYVDGLNSLVIQNSLFQSCGNQVFTPPYDEEANPHDIRLKYYDINGSGSGLPSNARGALIFSSDNDRQYYIISTVKSSQT